ncbi:putative membrane protein YedE/YeeE [Methylohalomonas lacus]|uniref:Membrane protein YedE/YeeE n=1 Tax=Methylohalomonas lacus TaxID=398773 RepID=A0AAE3HKG6_9GAMM|nr:DUF6691 family protein [Methylohalomonas lacus]MCS3904005.1 putative membrane protein YedE/YeeE [Methylohalomonas lacus]
MLRNLSALLAGVVFGIGLALSGMVYPLKVLAFLDVSAAWDPSLALVMLGAVAVTLPAFALVLKRHQPLLATRFYLPRTTDLDARLITGAALFGIGWGIGGYCPGPALAALGIHWQEGLPFLAAVAAGGLVADRLGARH